jgi:hypothetical protein
MRSVRVTAGPHIGEPDQQIRLPRSVADVDGSQHLLRYSRFHASRRSNQMRNISLVFLVLAVAFIALGISGQRTFLFVGLAFLVVAMLRFLPRRR